MQQVNAGFTPDIPEQMNHAPRLRLLRRQMKQRGIEGLLVTHLPDVRYLCGFTGSNAYLGITASSRLHVHRRPVHRAGEAGNQRGTGGDRG